MKKQFFRVKQLADQTFLRADRSECLNQDELKKAEWKVEYISKVFTEIIKKLPAPVNQGDILEKRKKKYYEYILGNTMVELANCEEVGKRTILLKEILRECGDVELRLSEDQQNYESRVEQYVSVPINDVLEKEIPNINKQKKNVNKYLLDKDSATSRYQNASKNGIQKENLKEDMDEADVKVDQSRDVLAVEMFGLLSKEHEMCTCLLQLLKMQRGYHESALTTLESVIPTLEKKIGESHIKPVFGLDLAKHLKQKNRTIAYPIELCVLALTELGMSEEGLFRIAGGASKVKRLKLSIDSGCFTLPLIPEYKDVHVLASALKSYLRELPEPLLTHKLYNEWLNAMKNNNNNDRHQKTKENDNERSGDPRLRTISELIDKLPKENRDNLGYLIQFLSNLTKHHENKMTVSNIAIVMSPNLLWARDEEINVNMKNCATVNMLVEFMISNVGYLFPDGEELLVKHSTLKRVDLIGLEKISCGDDISLVSAHEVHSGRVSSCYYDQELMSSPKPTLRRKVKAPAPPLHQDNHEFSKGDRHKEASDETFVYSKNNEGFHKNQELSMKYENVGPTKNHETTKAKENYIKNHENFTKHELMHNYNSENKNAVKDTTYNTLPLTRGNKSKAKQWSESTSEEDEGKGGSRRTSVMMEVTEPNVDHLVSSEGNVKVNREHRSESRSIGTQLAHANVKKFMDLVENEIQKKPNNIEPSNVPSKPVAAPRTSIPETTTAEKLVRRDSMSKSVNAMDLDETSGVQMRRPSRDDCLEPKAVGKPAIPVRPASLRTARPQILENADNVQKTQCSVYNTPHKQQPAIVTLSSTESRKTYAAGHDYQIAEKEKFLGHQTAADKANQQVFNSKYSNVNLKQQQIHAKPDLPNKPPIMKSNERLNVESAERINGNKTSHIRTRSDGNIVDVHPDAISLMQTPPSPKSVNKPNQPPPPPPVKKPEVENSAETEVVRQPETTNF